MNEAGFHPCPQDGCTVAIDGRCLEGFTPDECPHYQAADAWTDADETLPALAESPAEDDAGSVSFYPGDYLTEATARVVTRRSLTRVILLAGEPDSGKTTLLASLNDAFQKGPFAGYVFAGSLTLPGLERVCHKARLQSGRTRADTERTTPTEETRFLHLGVRSRETGRPAQHLLLADISGERFELVKNSTQEAAKLHILERADHVVLLLDGERLADPTQRHRAKSNAILLLRSCLDAGMLRPRSLVDVVFSKWDLVEQHAEVEQAKAFITRTRQDMEERFRSRVGRLRFFELAARPEPESSLTPGYGLDEMFTSWVEESPLLRAERIDAPVLSVRNREFARFR